jgi:hypothetical protein
MNAEFASLIRTGCYDASSFTALRIRTDDDRLPNMFWVASLFHRRVERIHVDMQDCSAHRIEE